MTGALVQGTRCAAIVYNPVKVDRAALEAALEAARPATGWAGERWYATTVEDAGAGLAAEAAAAGASVVVAAGGDGTVRAVAEGLHGSGVPLALIPGGTGNLLARNLGVEARSMRAHAHAVYAGSDMPIDVGVISLHRADGELAEHVFLVIAGMGIDAAMIARTDERLKRRVGWVAYLDGGFRALVGYRPLRVRYSIDDGAPRAVQAHSFMVGNCGELPGGMQLIPEARLDDGVLDVLLLRPRGTMGWLQAWHRVGWENRLQRAGRQPRRRADAGALEYHRAVRADVEADTAQDVQLDGDEFGQAIGFVARIDPGSLLVRI